MVEVLHFLSNHNMPPGRDVLYEHNGIITNFTSFTSVSRILFTTPSQSGIKATKVASASLYPDATSSSVQSVTRHFRSLSIECHFKLILIHGSCE